MLRYLRSQSENPCAKDKYMDLCETRGESNDVGDPQKGQESFTSYSGQA